jgi:hypothetical protein
MIDQELTGEEPDKQGLNAVRKLRKRRENDALILAMIVVAVIGAGLAITFASDLGNLFTESRYYPADQRMDAVAGKAAVIRIISAFITLGVFGLMTFLFASGSPIFRVGGRGSAAHVYDERMLEAALAEITQSAKTIAANRFVTAGDKQIITAELREVVQESLPAEYLAKIDEKYGSVIVNQKISEYFEEVLQTTKERLQSFQRDLSLKVASSLAWGIVTAVLGLATLFVFLLYPPDGAWNDIKPLFQFAARLGIVAMTEVVAFFFLNQYKFTLADLKYVNNEVTNVEMRLLSLIAAAKLNEKGAIAKILAELSKTERNFALKKGEVSIFSSGSGGDLLDHVVISEFLKSIFQRKSRGAKSNE